MIPAGTGPGAEFTFGNHLIGLKKGQTEKVEDGAPSELLCWERAIEVRLFLLS